MWKLLANPLREMVRTNVIEHKILDNIMYIDFFAVNMKVIIIHICALEVRTLEGHSVFFYVFNITF